MQYVKFKALSNKKIMILEKLNLLLNFKVIIGYWYLMSVI